MSEETWKYMAFLALSLGAVALTGILTPSYGSFFRRFFGSASPLLVVVAAAVAGGLSLMLLQSRGGFEVLEGRATLRGMALAASLATVLAVVVVIADFFIRYPADINVPLPQSLLFYPAIGYVVEIVFHLLPLTLLLVSLGALSKGLSTDRLVWICIFLTALLEPTFQLRFAQKPLSWAGAFTWIHVFAINLLQLYVFRRYDFVSMYSLRLFYYAYWHIAWGALRLRVLF